MRNPTPTWRFFALTFALSWACWIAAALTGQAALTFPTALFYVLGGFGPSLAAVWLVARHRDPDARRDFWRRLVEVRRIGWGWYLLIIAFIPTIFGLTIAIDRIVNGEAPGMEGLNQILSQPIALLPTVVIGLLMGPLSEELGWRGYALDRLRERWGARPGGLLRANLVLAFIWWVWHLPLFFIEGTSQQRYGIGTVQFWLFAANTLPLTLLITRAYYANQRSTLSAVLIHFFFNFTFGLVYPVSAQFDAIRVILTFIGVGLVLWVTRGGEDSVPMQAHTRGVLPRNQS